MTRNMFLMHLAVICLLCIARSESELCRRGRTVSCLQHDSEHGDMYPDVSDDECRGFWTCSNGKAVLRCCPRGMRYSPDFQVCVHEEAMYCPNADTKTEELK
ncbi:uncharacterized protein LOC111269242 [Varroa jacobsoni]|uniref:uncharacterized protein LOC111269242 n=1 Tax=Varroa jacobsoni TaxID=62625 RepID=UPI000BF8E1F2|nr:uncharacterized protein LOC111269242 [Varroa jacobsoni]